MTLDDTLSSVFHAGIRLAAGLVPGGETREAGLPGRLPEESFIDAGDVTLQCLRWRGDGPRVLLLHGLDVNAWIWAPVAGLLGGGRDVVSLSLRGHGGSTAPDQGYDLATTTRDIESVLDHLGWDSFHLAGHSWGGKIAVHLASENPSMVRSLALADPVPPWGFNPFLRALPWVVESVLKPERGPYANGEALAAGLRRMVYLKRWDDMDQRLGLGAFRERPDGSFHHTLPESGYREILDRTLQEDTTHRMGRIPCPALVLLPTFTVAFWPGETTRWKAGMPQVELRRLPGDHSFIYTNPVDTAREIDSFLQPL